MLVEVLCITERRAAGGALASGILAVVGEFCGGGGALFAAVGGGLVDAVDGRQMPLEDVCSVEALLGSRARARTEPTDHGTLVVGQSVSILVVFACEALEVVFTGDNGTLLRSLGLVGEHVGSQVSKDTSTVRMGTSVRLPAFIVEFNISRVRTRWGVSGGIRGN